jgi:hypothetical protein
MSIGQSPASCSGCPGIHLVRPIFESYPSSMYGVAFLYCNLLAAGMTRVPHKTSYGWITLSEGSLLHGDTRLYDAPYIA